MKDICVYFNNSFEIEFSNNLDEDLIDYKAKVTSVDGYVGGDYDFYLCEYCSHNDCLYNSFVNLY